MHLYWILGYAYLVMTRESSECSVDSVMSAMIPVAHYRVGLAQTIGNGAFGAVYQATDTRNGRYVAAKMASPKPKKAKEMAETEIKILTHLGYHKNIIYMYDHFTIDGNIWIMEEHCDLGDLQDYCNDNYLIANEINDVVLQAALAIEFLHSRKVIHRDVKPGNILIHAQGENSICIKVGDYGLSQISDQNNKPLNTSNLYSDVGTLGYKAPEMYNNAKSTAALDIFSLGVVLYALVLYYDVPAERLEELQPSIDGKSPGYVMDRTKTDLKLAKIVDRFLLRYKDIIIGMTRYNPAQRLTIKEVVKELEKFAEDDKNLFNGEKDIDIRRQILMSKNKEVVNILTEAANILDDQKLDVRIARTTFAGVGVLGGTLMVAGVALAFTTFGFSLILTAVGGGMGITSAVGGVGAVAYDKIVGDKKAKNVQVIIDEYDHMLLIFNKQKSAVGPKKIPTQTTDAAIEDKVSRAIFTSSSLVMGAKGGGTAIGGALRSGEAAVLATRSSFWVFSAGAKALAIGSVSVAGVGLVLNLGELIYNAIEIYKRTPSQIAEDLRGRAQRCIKQASEDFYLHHDDIIETI